MPRVIAPIAEFLGTLFLVLTVVGSGIMAQLLTEDVALQLLINASATVAMLYILINLIAPISGAHFNPVVTFIQVLQRQMTGLHAVGYVVAQVIGAIAGTLLAHLLFDRSLVEFSNFDRVGTHLFISEIVATFGLIVIVFADWKRYRLRHRASMIALWIGAAYFFTSSTSFANPAVTIGRMFTDSFAGISPSSVLPFVVGQVVGGLIAWSILRAVRKSLSEEKGK